MGDPFAAALAAASETIRETLQADFKKAAEPIIKQALEDIEKEIRKKLASAVVGILDRGYSLDRQGHELVIRVDLSKLTP